MKKTFEIEVFTRDPKAGGTGVTYVYRTRRQMVRAMYDAIMQGHYVICKKLDRIHTDAIQAEPIEEEPQPVSRWQTIGKHDETRRNFINFAKATDFIPAEAAEV